MKNKIAWAAMFALLLCCLQLGEVHRAFACSCVMPPNVQDALKDADAVFSGTVVSVNLVNQNVPGGIYSTTAPSREVVLSVVAAWKGVSRPTVTIVTGMGGGDCGYSFTSGDTYLVYAYRSSPGSPVFYLGDFRIEIALGAQQFGTSICTRTAPIALAAADLAQLGPGAQPTQGELLAFLLDNLLAVVAVVAALVVVLILYLLRRRRRRSFKLKL